MVSFVGQGEPFAAAVLKQRAQNVIEYELLTTRIPIVILLGVAPPRPVDRRAGMKVAQKIVGAFIEANLVVEHFPRGLLGLGALSTRSLTQPAHYDCLTPVFPPRQIPGFVKVSTSGGQKRLA